MASILGCMRASPLAVSGSRCFGLRPLRVVLRAWRLCHLIRWPSLRAALLLAVACLWCAYDAVLYTLRCSLHALSVFPAAEISREI